jgi:hypothetical protein
MVRDMTVKPAPTPVHVDEAETIRQLSETADRQCDGERRTCARPPVWGFDCLGCGHMFRACEGHREWLDRKAEHGIAMWCLHCSRPTANPLPWVPL